MKRLFVFMIAAAVLAWLPLTAAAEEDVYWNINESGATTITHKPETPSKSSAAKDAKSLAEKEVYDSGDPPASSDDDGDSAPQPRARRPIQSTPSVDRSEPASAPQRRPLVRQRRDTGSSGANTRESVKKPDAKRLGPTAEPAAAVEAPQAAQPKPSQVEAEPAEPKSKLPWGKDK